jgi:hypothetical protein
VADDVLKRESGREGVLMAEKVDLRAAEDRAQHIEDAGFEFAAAVMRCLINEVRIYRLAGLVQGLEELRAREKK